ncbi:hypothetical protein HPB48_012021 [Haemaphysalis longicornis]|uniref:Uncharacterized protein n=1 Tax=Haemaphysalis longicornis TaxID=44386 RepID=A0A9J6GA35_HAELO|nr:hypothetical protein HPB48_012021 [Haemaphysalis longicornis]
MELSGKLLPALPRIAVWERPAHSETPTTSKDARHRCDIMAEASWPNLELLCSLQKSLEFNPSHWQPVIRQKLVLELLDRFDSEGTEERDLLKTVQTHIYRKFLGLWAHIRKQINTAFEKLIYETHNFNEVTELLKVLGAIINGFTLPLKAEHKQFLVKVLIPLHQPVCLEHSQAPRRYCLVTFVAKHAASAEQIGKGLQKLWPKICSKKELLFLLEIEDILYVPAPTQFSKTQDTFFTQIAKCVCNPHSHVAERALYFWKNNYILSLIEKNNETGIPLMLSALYHTPKQQLDQTTVEPVYNALKRFMEINFKLFDGLPSA